MIKHLLAGLLVFIAVSSYGQSYKLIPGNVLDFGEVEEGTNKILHFSLINLSDTPLIIKNVYWGEPCFAPIYSMEPAFKGDTLKIKYVFFTFSMPPGTKVSKSSSVETNHGGFSISLKATVIKEPLLLNGDTVFQFVEKMPAYKGGEADMLLYISKNFNYPKQDELQTRFTVEFIVDTTGKVINPQIASDYHKTNLTPAETNLLEVFKTMPLWTPGSHNGRKVPVRMRVPVKVEVKD